MSKIIRLCQNELLKITKRASVIVLVIMMIAGIFASGGLIKLVLSISTEYYYPEYAVQSSEQIKLEIKRVEADIAALDKSNPSYTEQYSNLISELLAYTTDLEMYEVYSSNNISQTNNNGYIDDIAYQLAEAKAYDNIEKQYPDAGAYVYLESMNPQKIKRLENIIANNDYKDYIALQKENVKETFEDGYEKDIQLEALDLTLKANPDGENKGYMLNAAIQNFIEYSMSLETGINSSVNPPRPLSSDQRESLEKELIVTKYKLENRLISLDDNGMPESQLATLVMNGVGCFMVLVILLILAGGSISQEISSGSIKSLIISPTKRWKIFLSKIVSLLITGIFLTLLAYAVSSVASLILFGEIGYAPYIYASNGAAHEIPPALYGIAYMFADFIPVFVFMVFAFMLSIVTRNTAASVAIAIGTYFVGGMATGFMTQFGINGEWTKFIPFNNLEIASQMFPSSVTSQMLQEITLSTSPTLGFSLCYLAVLTICMLYTAFDSFTRRDI